MGQIYLIYIHEKNDPLVALSIMKEKFLFIDYATNARIKPFIQEYLRVFVHSGQLKMYMADVETMFRQLRRLERKSPGSSPGLQQNVMEKY